MSSFHDEFHRTWQEEAADAARRDRQMRTKFSVTATVEVEDGADLEVADIQQALENAELTAGDDEADIKLSGVSVTEVA